QTIVRELFENESPIGQQVRINGRPFTVIGVLGFKGANMTGMDQDDIVLAPWTTIKFKVAGQSAQTVNQSAATATDPNNTVNTLTRTSPGQPSLYPVPSATQQADTPRNARFINVDQLLVKARSAERINEAITQINEVLRERHHIKAGQPDDWTVR